MKARDSSPLGEQAILRWTQGWPRSLVVGLGLLATAAVGLADFGVARLLGYDFVATGLYLVPIGFVAFVAGTRCGLLIAVAAAATETIATFAALEDPRHAWAVPITILLELLVFVAAALAQGAIRRFVFRERRLSRHDSVTGVGNALGFREAAGWEIARGRRWPGVVSLIYLDVDDFKAVNDKHGHVGGDEVLRIVGQAMKRSLRECDVVARVGGDEFAALMPGTDEEGCRAATARVHLNVTRDLAEAGFPVTASVGATTFATAPETVDEMIGAADGAMFAVKHGSKNGVHHFVARGQVPPVHDASRRGAAGVDSPQPS
jgi:diguanylate cyclase (GGDEF)-like protein